MTTYEVRAQGPGDGSTYSECWGSTATSRGRLVVSVSSLAEALTAAIEDDRDDAIYQHRRGNWEYLGSVDRGRVQRSLTQGAGS